MDFLVFAPNPWQGLWRNRQQIFSRLAGKHRVLYVEPAQASLADWRRGRVSLSNLRRPAVVEQQPNLWLYRIPAWLPTRATDDVFDRASDALLAMHLRHALRSLGFLPSDSNRFPLTVYHYPLLWLYRPTHWRWAAASFPHRLLVYHITDDYTAFTHLSPAERQALAEEERELLAAADLTIVTAPRLLELKRPYAKRIEFVPNGVDYEAFQHALADPIPLAEVTPTARTVTASWPLSTGHRPPITGHPSILGYSGHVSARLDLPLLRELALARPGWQFVFAGSEDARSCEAELAALKAMPNIHFLGLLPVGDVPHFIAACDVCLIPYRVNDETRAISSLKLYEYLAVGKPVVSAAVPAAEEYPRVVNIAKATAESWLAAIEQALATAADPQGIAARQAIAAANTWEERVKRIDVLLQAVDLSQTCATA
jgi:glycosyltransferase involved in cell wall biosynthesis